MTMLKRKEVLKYMAKDWLNVSIKWSLFVIIGGCILNFFSPTKVNFWLCLLVFFIISLIVSTLTWFMGLSWYPYYELLYDTHEDIKKKLAIIESWKITEHK
jgi:hypothetical protein